MQTSPLLAQLRTLGLSDKEGALYLALLELGPSTAYQIAKKSGIKRPTTYVLLQNLCSRGVVALAPEARRKLYIPKDPKLLFSETLDAITQAQKIVPHLKSLQKAEREKIQVLYYQGFEGVEEAMRYGMSQMEGKEMVAFWAEVSEETDKRFHYFKEWHDLFKQYQIPLRAFIPDGEIHHKYRKYDTYYKRTMRIISKKQYCPYTFFDMGDTFTRFFDPTHMQAVVIENPSVTHALRQIFELVWSAGYGK